MASAHRLFRNIWRVNAVIIFVAGIILVLVGLAGLYEIVSWATRDLAIHDVVVEDERKAETRLWIGSFETLAGVPAAIAPYHREQSYALRSYSKTAASIVDYLIVDTRDGSSWRLRGEDQGIVVKRWLFPSGRAGGLGYRPDTEPVSLIAVSAVSSDTNGDGRITSGDRKHLIAATPDGSLKKRIAEDIGEVLLFAHQDGALRLIYRKTDGGGLMLRIVDPTTLTLTSKTDIAPK